MKKSYNHLKLNVLKNLSFIAGTEKVIDLVRQDKIEEALNCYSSINPRMRFSLSDSMARQQIESMKNDLVRLAEAKMKK